MASPCVALNLLRMFKSLSNRQSSDCVARRSSVLRLLSKTTYLFILHLEVRLGGGCIAATSIGQGKKQCTRSTINYQQ